MKKHLFFLIFGSIQILFSQNLKIKLDLKSDSETLASNPFYYDLKPLSHKKNFKNIPELDSLKLFFITIDPLQNVYDRYKNGSIDKAKALKYFKDVNIDTLSLSQTKLKQELFVVIGFKRNKQILVADSNQNGDFADDIYYEFTIGKDVSLEEMKRLPTSTFEFDYFDNGVIYKIKRKFVLIPYKNHMFSQHLEKEYVPYLSFVKFTDAWYGKLKHNKENFSFLINDLYTNSHFYFKKDSVLLNVDNIYNSQYKYRLKDTIAVGKDFFKVIRSNDLKTLYLNKVASFKSVYYKSGDKIPDYEVTNLKNEEVGIKSFIKDKNYLLIEFWGTWCGPCLKFQPEIESFYAKNNNKIALLGVAVDKSVTTVKNYVDKKQLSWENTFIKLGTKNTFLDDLKIKGYPTIILLDKNQRILFLGSGTKENLQIVEKMIKH